MEQARRKKKPPAIKIKSQTRINLLLGHQLTLADVWVSVCVTSSATIWHQVVKTLCDIAIVTILLRQCWFQHCHTSFYVPTPQT